MKTLKELQDLGVKELRISNGQAVAVNPYDEMNLHRDTTARYRELFEKQLAVAALPPLPCHESVKEGTYPIGRFSEIMSVGIIAEGEVNERCYPHKVLVLSEPVAESEDDTEMLFHECDQCNTRCNCDTQPCSCDCRDEVAEKPEGERLKDVSTGYWFSNEHGHDVEVLAVVGDFCMVKDDNREEPYTLPLELISAIKNASDEFNNILNTPEAEPVESAEEFIQESFVITQDELGNIIKVTPEYLARAMEEYVSLRVAQALKK